ncbi:MAG: sterol desaturase family protein [Chitinophagaceae bacterium]
MHKFDAIATIPVFTAFFIEFVIILRHNPQKNLIKDIKANFVLGAILLVAGAFVKGVEFSLFSLLYSFSIFKPEPSWWLWIAALLCCDFIHYFYHWLGHKTRLFWAAHVTHHSSVHFNLSTALRTNFIHLLYRFLFWSPLCFIGFPPLMVMFIESFTVIQNFIVHTEKVKKLGVLDWVFNTPSNHRVHHGCNPEYIDKNLGGIFMFYDHLFGTYAKETIRAVYGITHNIDTHNPYKIILHEYIRLAKEFPKIKGFSKKIRYLLSPPQ